MEQLDSAQLRQEFARLNARLDAIEAKIDAVLRAPAPMAAPAAPMPSGNATLNVPEGVLQLLQGGQRQQAIDAYQQLSGVDQRTAEAVVNSLAVQRG
jgi:hypothetical protein